MTRPLPALKGATLEGELALQTDTRRTMRLGLLILAIGFGGLLLWAAFAPLDEGVPTHGIVTIDTKRKPVQHLSGGLVREILVHEGEMVTAGQVVARLDDANSRANFEAIRQHYLGLLAMESRLIAEQTGEREIRFHNEVLAAEDASIRQQVAAQRALFNSRRAALDAELAAIAESIRGFEALLTGQQLQLASLRQQRELLATELAGVRELVVEGYAPRNRESELERQLAALEGSIASLEAERLRAQQSIAELKQRSQQRQLEYRKEADAQLAQIRLELQADREKFHAAQADLERTELRAPVAGQVVGLMVQAAGAVVQPGQKLMDIVPQDEALLLEARIPPHLIDRVEAGQKADIRFNAFVHSPTLVVEGRVVTVSRDLLSEQTPTGMMSYYLARVAVTPEGFKTLGERRLQPGMPAEVIIKTGERSLLTYLLHPLVKRIAASMKEE